MVLNLIQIFIDSKLEFNIILIIKQKIKKLVMI